MARQRLGFELLPLDGSVAKWKCFTAFGSASMNTPVLPVDDAREPSRPQAVNAHKD